MACSIYLWCPVALDGDGAVYELQVRFGDPLERSIHAGWLAPLWLLHRVTGLPPQAAGLLWGSAALLLSAALGARLLAARPREPGAGPPTAIERAAPLLAPAVLLAAAATWRATGSVEVYGPMAAVLLAGALAVESRRGLLAGALLAWAAAIHPGAWLLVPGVLLLVGADRATAVRATSTAAALHAVVLFGLWPDWWSGPRGLAAAAAAEQGPLQSVQAAWRLVARDLGPASLPLLAGIALLDRRRLAGVGLLVLGAALTDRWSDNPGQLPVLWLAAAAAPLAVRWIDALDEPRLRRVAAVGVVALMLLGLAEATTRHDAVVRGARSEAAAMLGSHCEQAAWRDRVRCDLIQRTRR